MRPLDDKGKDMKFVLNKKTILIIVIAIVVIVPSIVLPIVLTNRHNGVESITVTFMLDDVTVHYTVTACKGESIATNVPIPTNGDYEFRGWYLDYGEWQVRFDSELPIEEDTLVYAYWYKEEDTDPEIRYGIMVTDGTFLIPENLVGQSEFAFLAGTNVQITADNKEDEGKAFDYWELDGAEDENGNQIKYYDNPYTIFEVWSSMHLIARYKPLLAQYTVKVEGGKIVKVGETSTDINAESGKSFDEGSSITVQANIPEGRSFDYWEINGTKVYENPHMFVLAEDIIAGGEVFAKAFFGLPVGESEEGIIYEYEEESGSYIVTGVSSVLPNLTIPKQYKDDTHGIKNVTKIKENAFAYNSNIRLMIIPNTITHIESNAFAHCENLDMVYIPQSVNIMGNNVFEGCDPLLTIYTYPKTR